MITLVGSLQNEISNMSFTHHLSEGFRFKSFFSLNPHFAYFTFEMKGFHLWGAPVSALPLNTPRYPRANSVHASLRIRADPVVWLNEDEDAFFEDVEDGGEEEGQSQEDEQLVRQLPPVVLEDQLPPQVDGSRHISELLVGFLHRPGGCG